ncbi:MAG: RagB/SusD family nutrient uptake outer membrane protein [Bacteroidales bacterium]|nr:RagB/SusD family nutrient uptake outer membrane protein [Bacteroidales bacterium]MBN2763722.1 RagB/SusD family nutrient uptake outer membrane protein [Bacteroidales bacterium]
MKYLLLLLTVVVVFSGCEDLIEPADDNHRILEDIYDDPVFAEGILMNAYTRIPTGSYSFNDAATDDAVTNDKFSGYLNMATGQWSSINNPVDQWENSYTAIMYLNRFLAETDEVNWSYRSDTARILFNYRHKGEAYALRALFMLNLLQTHGGYSPGGELLGVPIINEVLEDGSDFRKPRNTFEECMLQIYSDLAEAENYLPLDYADADTVFDLPAKYNSFSVEEYNRVFGDVNMQRISGRIAKAVRAKAALLAASPAFSEGTSTTWEDAANYAAEVIDLNGGVSSLDPKGALFFKSTNVDAINLTRGRDQGEMMWRGSIYTGYNLEQDNFPPSLYGRGRINPTQNLVDAFPMENGYPITDAANSGYDPANPYNNRDPRLANTIVVNGSTMAGKVINTSTNGGDDAVDYLKTSTRTGYYLRKLLREDVNVDPTVMLGKKHYPVHIRYTEIFLAYAEAANEAWGPDGKGPHAYSARDVIAAIRSRAGITQPDSYLASISSKEDMRALIQNERRLELCFEGFRFWDLRRWKKDLTEPAMGVRITDGNFVVSTVEKRLYEDYMVYPPLPYNEVLKTGMVQNNGW